MSLPEPAEWLHQNVFNPFLDEVKEERIPEVNRVSEHVEISLTEVIGRADLEIGRAEEEIRKQSCRGGGKTGPSRKPAQRGPGPAGTPAAGPDPTEVPDPPGSGETDQHPGIAPPQKQRPGSEETEVQHRDGDDRHEGGHGT